MRASLGIIEVRGLASAITVADTMVKAADVKVFDIEKTKGSGWMTVKVTGRVGAVEAAIAAGRMVAIQADAFVTSKVIPRPNENIEAFFLKTKPKAEPVVNAKAASSETAEVSVDADIDTVVVEVEDIEVAEEAEAVPATATSETAVAVTEVETVNEAVKAADDAVESTVLSAADSDTVASLVEMAQAAVDAKPRTATKRTRRTTRTRKKTATATEDSTSK